MAPPKSSRNNDETKPDGPTTASGANHKTGGGHTSTKMRRVASQTNAAHLREAPTSIPAAPAQAPAEPAAPNLQWSAFGRNVLHAYRREHHLNTPTSFASSYHKCLLSQTGGIGLYSPTMALKKHTRRQSKDRLAMAVRKHFNGMGVQENDVIVDFIYKVRSDNTFKNNGPGPKINEPLD